jgi:FkbM family methyltransferase
MADANAAGTQIGPWRESQSRMLAARLLYPLFWLVNRPSLAPVGRALYDIALRCNGIAINYEGPRGLTLPEARLLARLAPQLGGGVVLDVGAHSGSYALEVKRLAPAASLFAFEPQPRTYAAMAGRVAGTGIEALNLALGESEGTATLYDFAGDGGSTQASLSADAVALFGTEPVAHSVACTTVDAFCAERGIDGVALLKVDTEGFDLNVLRGARRMLAERRIERVQFEFISANIATGVRLRDFYVVLAGYRLHRLCLNGALMPLPYSVKHGEIYVNQNLVALREGPAA